MKISFLCVFICPRSCHESCPHLEPQVHIDPVLHAITYVLFPVTVTHGYSWHNFFIHWLMLICANDPYPCEWNLSSTFLYSCIRIPFCVCPIVPVSCHALCSSSVSLLHIDLVLSVLESSLKSHKNNCEVWWWGPRLHGWCIFSYTIWLSLMLWCCKPCLILHRGILLCASCQCFAVTKFQVVWVWATHQTMTV